MWFTVAVVVLGGFTALYLWTKKRFSYFADRGIPAMFPFSSNNMKMMLGQLSFLEAFDSMYHRFRGTPLVGFYGPFGEKGLVVQDMELIKDVLIKDFNHFVDRRQVDFGDSVYLTNMLLVLTGEKWKTMRNMVSPIFTSGKLKAMTPLVQKVGGRMVNHLKKYADDGTEFEAKDMMAKFATDVVGSTGFGIEVNSFSDPDSIFHDNVAKLRRSGKYQRSRLEWVMFIIAIMLPRLGKLMKIKLLPEEPLNFLVSIIKQQMEDRKQKPNVRNDFIDILTQALQNANMRADEAIEEQDQFEQDAVVKGGTNNQMFTKEELEVAVISNAFLLFSAGFDTSSTGMAITTYCLAKNQEVQEKLYDEIRTAIEENKMQTELDYNRLQQLPYLDMCINEALRYYPIVNLERKCVKDYRFRGTNFTVLKGMMVCIPSVMMSKDEKYFPNPMQYNPDNFSREALAERGPYPFMSFGHGPRNCVGKRFALLQVKVAIFHMIANYKVLPCSKTVDVLQPDPPSPSFQPKGGLWVKIEKRESAC